MKKRHSAPWTKKAPKRTRRTKLSSTSKGRAKASAKRAGRRYPNLVDNMNAAKKQKKTSRARRS